MEDTLVSLETARLLMERGFCEGSTHFYNNLNSKQELIDNKGAYYINGMVLDYIEAPTQSLAQKWLRDVHQVNVFINSFLKIEAITYMIKIVTLGEKPTTTIILDNLGKIKTFYTYEEALEEGLKEALKLVTK